jgi:hypothetical protein
MERTARALAGYGRHGDNNLLHVSDQELRGIELLSGKKFTRNPDTGLPEAFNWSSLIPIAAGIAGTAVGGPLGGALASGVASGGIAAAEGKSAQEALTKGLISGVTSYAGGELLAGVPDAAAKAATETAAQTASQTAAQGAAQSAAQAGSGVGSAVTVEPLGEITAAGISPAVGPTTTIPEVAGAGIPSTQVAPGLTVPAPSQEATFGEKISNIVSEPKASLSQISKNIKASPFNALIATGGTYAQAMDMLGPPKMPGEEPYDPSKYPEQFPVNPRTWNAPGAGYQPGYSPEYRYFAEGGYVPPPPEPPKEKDSGKIPDFLSMGVLGAVPAMMGMDRDAITKFAPANILRNMTQSPDGDLERERERYRTLYQAYMANPANQQPAMAPGQPVGMAKGGLSSLRKEDGVTANVMNEAKAALLGEHPRPSEALGRFRNMFGEDALDVLRDKVTGGRVRGAGGGMDDLVPGTIEGRQQVRLADGEFVLPAHIVSAIGDGSTDHGVRRLKEMMDSIYRQKYKSDSLPKRLKKGTLVDE